MVEAVLPVYVLLGLVILVQRYNIYAYSHTFAWHTSDFKEFTPTYACPTYMYSILYSFLKINDFAVFLIFLVWDTPSCHRMHVLLYELLQR